MKKIGLSCFEGFKCKADKCRDSCCIGWEIDIDQATLEKYRNYKGKLKERFENCIDYGENPHFILGEGERCPFLNKDGLCDIIIDSGEEMLCEICDKHPRFYEWLPGITFEGYGIGCEKAAEMLIDSDKDIYFTEQEIIDSDEESTADDKCFIVLDVLKKSVRLIQNRNRPMADRLMLLLAFASNVQNAVEEEDYQIIPQIIDLYSDEAFMTKQLNNFKRFETDSWEENYKKIIEIYRSLETLDERWHKHLDLLYNELDVVTTCETTGDRTKNWENMAIYLLFRHLPAAYFDEDFLARIKFVITSWLTNGLLMRVYLCEKQAEMAAMYSKEIEYSDENLPILLDMAYTEDALSTESLMGILLKLRGI